MFYLIWNNYFGIPWLAALGLLLFASAYFGYGVRALIRSAASYAAPAAPPAPSEATAAVPASPGHDS